MKKTHFLTLFLILFSKIGFAQYQSAYIGEIRVFAGTFAPAGWAMCDGSLLSISEYDTLYNLIGTTYGGDGVTTFAVPDLQSRIPVGQGSIGGANYILGAKGGSEQVRISSNNLPSHSHQAQLQVNTKNATLASPTSTAVIATAGSLSGRTLRQNLNYNEQTPDVALQTVTTSSTGNSNPDPISIVKPYLGLRYIINLYGIYPTPY